ncbi:MAG TPA: ABC transporter permease, partial [Blastocatellia bacterium]|nr:ABC transporter permease [Blastocatellia bacterium]
MSSLMQDLRYSVRLLLKQPGFTAVAVIMLALGIGANTSIFSVINAALLRPLPFENPDRLVIVNETVRRDTVETRPASYMDFTDWRERNQTFEDLAAFDDPGLNLSGGDGSERVTSEIVSASYFTILGVNARIGRTFLPEEDRAPDASPVTVLSHRLWQRRFNSDPNIVNQTLKINEKDFTVVGVMPEGFVGVTGTAEIWIPMTMVSTIRSATVLQQRGSRWHQVIGRLKPSVTVAQAQADLTAIAEGLEQAYPASNKDRGVQVVAAHEAVVGDLRPVLIVLLCAVAFVLLIACVNVANLLLARASVRQKEIAIRTALGAGRARLIRQMLTESVLLSTLGGALGLLLAVWGIDLIVAFMGDQLPTLIRPGIDPGVLSFTLLVSFVTGLVFGLAPALQASKAGLNEILKEGGRGASGSARRHKLRRALVVTELALALVLLTGAGLMLRSFQQLQKFDPGFKADNVLALRMNLPRSYTAAQMVGFNQQVIDRASAMPGVVSVGTASDTPLDGTSSATIAAVETADPDLNEARIYVHRISPSFFAAMGIPMVSGRDFTPQDTREAPPVTVISEAMAKRLWPNEDPLTKRLSLDEDKDGKPIWIQVVGVVGDVKYRNLIRDQNND